MEIKVGRPKGGKLTDEQKIQSKLHIKEYQKKYRESHRSQTNTLKHLINEISQIKIMVLDKNL